MQVSDTFDIAAAQKSYYGQLFPLNPSGLIPTGPTPDDLKLGVDPKRGSFDAADIYSAAANLTS